MRHTRMGKGFHEARDGHVTLIIIWLVSPVRHTLVSCASVVVGCRIVGPFPTLTNARKMKDAVLPENNLPGKTATIGCYTIKLYAYASLRQLSKEILHSDFFQADPTKKFIFFIISLMRASCRIFWNASVTGQSVRASLENSLLIDNHLLHPCWTTWRGMLATFFASPDNILYWKVSAAITCGKGNCIIILALAAWTSSLESMCLGTLPRLKCCKRLIENIRRKKKKTVAQKFTPFPLVVNKRTIG